MNFKRISAAALAAVLTAALVPASLAAGQPEGWKPADGARGPALISVNPLAGGYDKAITVNGKALEGYEYSREVPGWGSETVSVTFSEIPNAPTGYLPLRAVIQADHGSAYWDGDANQSTFYLEGSRIVTDFNDMSISVNDKKGTGEALLIEGVTYVPADVLELLDGVTVANKSTASKESYEITTPNGTPLMKMAYELQETANMGMGMKSSPAEMEDFYGESMGFKASYMTEGVAFLPMSTTPDTLVVGKMAKGQEKALKDFFEAYRQQQADTFSWYLSQNLPKVENAQFVTEGDWFLFLIAENADQTVESFHAAVKAMGK